MAGGQSNGRLPQCTSQDRFLCASPGPRIFYLRVNC